MSTGFITLHRKITEWEWYDDANTFRLFIHLLLNANHADKQWRGITINRGQFLTSLDTLSLSLKLSVQKIRTSLKKLESTNEITNKSTNKNRVITLVKYDSYQDKQGKDNKLNNKQVTNKQQTDNKQVTTTNNENNENNETIKKRKAENKFSDDDYLLANHLLSEITQQHPNFKKPNINAWADVIRLMKSQDLRESQEIKLVIDYCTSNDFWQSIILSAKKLRDKFDQLAMQSNKGTRNEKNQKNTGYKQSSPNGILGDIKDTEW